MRKYIFLIVLVITLGFCTKAQTPYLYNVDATHKGGVILNGIVTKYLLANDSSFRWYKTNQTGYTPSANVLNAMATAKDKYQFVVFGGTWCSDTQFILPKFFALQEKSGYPDAGISFFAVDREKHTVGNIDAAFQVKNVPTIIVMKNGQEVGRVVEYGKTGKWDEELAALIK
ncbi:MAG: thioredoxin family protein [Ferruginibacter sp.]